MPNLTNSKNIYTLAIESSCDDTSAAVLRNDKVLSNIVAGQKVHEEMVLALATGMADKTLRGDLDNLMQISITLWGFTHGTIQLAQTKAMFMATMGISKESFMNQAVELVMQSLINRNSGGKK